MKNFLRNAVLALGVALAAGCGEKTADVGKLIAEAKLSRDAGKHSAAIIHLKNVLAQAPEQAEARYLLGASYVDSGDFPSAEKELRRALELRYDPARTIPLLGRALLVLGEFKKVLDEIRIEGQDPGAMSAELLSLRGLATIGLGRAAEGRDLLAQALAKEPEHPDALLGTARVLASEKKVDEAMQLVDRALAAAPRRGDAWLMKGDLNRISGDSKAALDAFQKALDLSPENLAARLNIASMHISSGDYDAASVQVEQLRKIAPGNPMATYMQALIEFRKKNYPAAKELVLQVLKVAPNHPPGTLLAGAVEFALGSHVQAQAYLGRFVERAPGNLYARKLLVSSLAKSGHVQRALETLQPALKQAPGDASLLALAGEVYMQSNEFATAARYFEGAAKLDPKSAGARTGLGLSRLAAGESDRALADLESAVEIDADKFQADILLIMSHLQRAQFDKALNAVRSLEKKQPDNPLTYNLKAAVYIGKKDIASARKELERALQLQPTYVPAAANLAQLDLQDKNQKAARGRFEEILARDAGNVQALLALANLAPRLGATQEERMAWLERARRAGPGLVQPALMLARAHLQAKDNKKALEEAQRALTIRPDDPETLDTLGGIQLAAGEKEQALATFTKLVAAQPSSPVALYRYASAQAASADYGGATASLRKALALKQDMTDAQVALIELELRAGRHAEAMKLAQQVQKQQAKSPIGHVLEGDVLMAEKKYPQAVKAYESAYALGRSGLLAIKLHAAYARAGKPDEGEARLVQRIKEAPEDGSVRVYMAEASLRSGKFRQAIEQYEWVLGKQPENVLALNNLAWAYQQVKDPRAVQIAERAYKLKPDNPAVADTLGWILVEKGDLKAGIDLLSKASSAAPKSADIRYHLAQALAKDGDRARARQELERLLTDTPDFRAAKEALQLLSELRK